MAKKAHVVGKEAKRIHDTSRPLPRIEPAEFAAALGAYLLLALRYPWHRKYNSPADVGCAAGRYTARYLAGFFAIGLPCSWLPLVIATIIFGIVVMIERYPGRRR